MNYYYPEVEYELRRRALLDMLEDDYKEWLVVTEIGHIPETNQVAAIFVDGSVPLPPQTKLLLPSTTPTVVFLDVIVDYVRNKDRIVPFSESYKPRTRAFEYYTINKAYFDELVTGVLDR